MVYLLGITTVALFGRPGPSFLASVLSVLAYDFFFIPPTYSFAVADIQHLLTLVMMFVVAQVISFLTIRIRRQAEILHAIFNIKPLLLYSLSRQLASIRGIDKLLERGTRYLAELYRL